MSMSVTSGDLATDRDGLRFTILSPNPSKRAAELFYFWFFLLTLPLQIWVTTKLSYTSPNDLMLGAQGMFMGCVAWLGPLYFRAAQDKGKPFHEVYGFKFGCFLFVWAVLGGYLGTDPWYEVLHGHFAFNTEWNPNGVPFFMLPMTIAVFGAYTTILGALFRMIWWAYSRIRSAIIPDFVIKTLIFIPLAALMPLLETLGYTSKNYCFDNAVGQWFLNVFIYGSWHLAAIPFYTHFEETAKEPKQPCRTYWIKGFATVGLLLLLMQLVTDLIAPHYTTIHRGVRNVNDWSTENCLGPKPTE